VGRLWTPKWVLVHVAAVALVVTFLSLGWWQVTRAAEGNLLSFGYALEWPAFAAFVIFVWTKEVRRARRAEPPVAPPAPRAGAARPVRHGPAYDDDGDQQLAAYNRYLAWLNANPHASPRDYPG
jgi:DNA-binding transcriptional regulator of glucitol operon